MYNPDFPFALESANPLPPPPPPPAAFTAAAMAVVSPVGSLADLLDLVKGGPPGGPIEVISVVPQEALLMYDALRSVETGHGWKVVNSDRVRVLSFLDRTLGVVESVAAPRLSVNPADNSAIRQMRKFADEVSGLGRRVGGSIRDPARALADNLEELATAAEQHTLTNDAIQLLCTTVTQLRSQLVHLNQPPEPEKPALPFDD